MTWRRSPRLTPFKHHQRRHHGEEGRQPLCHQRQQDLHHQRPGPI
jgi:hypothetical protein